MGAATARTAKRHAKNSPGTPSGKENQQATTTTTTANDKPVAAATATKPVRGPLADYCMPPDVGVGGWGCVYPGSSSSSSSSSPFPSLVQSFTVHTAATVASAAVAAVVRDTTATAANATDADADASTAATTGATNATKPAPLFPYRFVLPAIHRSAISSLQLIRRSNVHVQQQQQHQQQRSGQSAPSKRRFRSSVSRVVLSAGHDGVVHFWNMDLILDLCLVALKQQQQRQPPPQPPQPTTDSNQRETTDGNQRETIESIRLQAAGCDPMYSVRVVSSVQWRGGGGDSLEAETVDSS